MLDKSARPVVFCDPENGWYEIIGPDDLECEDPLAGKTERNLKKQLFHFEKTHDDFVLEASLYVPFHKKISGWGPDSKTVPPETLKNGAYTREAPLKDYDMLDQLRFPTFSVDFEKTNAEVCELSEIFKDILQVSVKDSRWWSLGITQTAIRLRGLENFMLDMYDEEEIKITKKEFEAF